MNKKFDHYKTLLEENLRIGNSELNEFLVKGLKENDLNNLLSHPSKFYNTGIFEGNIDSKNMPEYLYLTFARNLHNEIHFILYKLTEKGKNFDPNEILAFAAYCADQVKISKSEYIGLSKEFLGKLSFIGYMERMQ